MRTNTTNTLLLAITIGGALAGTAAAERPALAIAVNSPLSWRDADALAASVYVGFDTHQAIRLNVARYENWTDFDDATQGALTLGQDDGDGPARLGHFTDVGLSWMYFPRRLWSGAFVDLGALGRDNDISVGPGYESMRVVTTQTKTIACRALGGWSVLIGGHVFASVSLGFSVGYERGSETTDDGPGMQVTRSVSRVDPSVEGFVRIGGVIGL